MPKKLFYLLFFFTLLFSFIDFSNAQQSVVPAAPVIIEPKEGEEVSTLTPVISWLASEGADVYSWLVYDVKDSKIVAFSTTKATKAYIQPYKLEWGKSYKLWVTACSLPQNGNLCSQFSERNFKVIPQNSLKVVTPNGGEVWQEGTTQKIIWQDNIVVPQSNVLPPPVSYDIDLISYYPCNPGSPCPAIAPLNYKIARSVPGFIYEWSVGKVLDAPRISHGSYIIQVCRTNTNICDSSDKPFRIVSQPSQPVITVIFPNGGEVLEQGKTYEIKWLTQKSSEPSLLPGPYVRIELWKGGKYLRTLFSMTPNDSKELWTVPKNLKDGRDYRIKIIDVQRKIFDFSDADFTITSSPVSLSNSSLIRQLENQAASLSEALFELIENLKNLK